MLSIQSNYIDPKTHNQHKALSLSKRTLGYNEGLAAKIYSGGGNEVIIAEGAKTAASLIVAKPQATIYSSFGRVGTIANYGYLAERHGTDTLLIAADNDDADPQSKTWQSVQKAAIQLAKQGITVNIAKPKELTAKDSFYEKPVKTDFNDILQQRGTQAVIDNIQPNHTIDTKSNCKIKLIKTDTKKHQHRYFGTPLRAGLVKSYKNILPKVSVERR